MEFILLTATMGATEEIKGLETRTIDIKALEEQRASLVEELNGLIEAAQTETRSLTEEEVTKFNDTKKKITDIDRDLELINEARSLTVIEKQPVDPKKKKAPKGDDPKEKDPKAKEDDSLSDDGEVRSLFTGEVSEETRAMNTTDNGSGGYVVKSTLAKEIIKELKDRSNVFAFFEGTSIAGDVRIPKKVSSGEAKWIKENPEDGDLPDASVPKLEMITLKQHRLYRESAITQQMINSQEINLNAFIKDDIADSMQDAIEAAIFYGTGEDEPTGIIPNMTTKQKITLDTRGSISFDDLKKAKFKLKKKQWKHAKWFMNSDTLLQLDLLKDADGRPLIQPDITGECDYKILNIPVELSDEIKTMSDPGNQCVIILATPKAYKTNTQKRIALYIYDDSAYKKRGLVGYGCDTYMDGKPVDDKSYVGIFNPAATRSRGSVPVEEVKDEA